MMPYIREHLRQEMDEAHNLQQVHAFDSGSLNYVITKLVHKYLGPSPNYMELNSVIGVLECAKLELYRRVVAPYEDKKIKENGDVP